MVPGSTLMYGSSLTIATLSPRASRIAPSEAAAMPLPNEDTTPPVTNTKRVICKVWEFPSREAAAEKVGQRRRASRLAHLHAADRGCVGAAAVRHSVPLQVSRARRRLVASACTE